MLFSFTAKMRSCWWCLFFVCNLIFYHLKYFLWRKCRKVCKKHKDLYFRLVCISENSCRAILEQNRWTITVRFWMCQYVVMKFGDYILSCLLLIMHFQLCLLCHSCAGYVLIESPRSVSSSNEGCLKPLWNVGP